MSKIDLTSPEWCELVFQNRNRSYGAFKLRADSKKRHGWAMMSVILIALLASAIPTLIKYATPEKVIEKMVEVAVLSQLEEAEVGFWLIIRPSSIFPSGTWKSTSNWKESL